MNESRVNYDTVAPFYDRLSMLVFGNTLQLAAAAFLPSIPANATILIAGGGTGKVLEDIALLYPQGLHIDYIDSSAKMIRLAKKRNCGANAVTFICRPVHACHFATPYDVIITPFLFDNFSEAALQKVFAHMQSALRPGGLWFYSDFQISTPGSFVQKTVLRVMYIFFRWMCHIEARHLPDVAACFARHRFVLRNRKVWRRGFIEAAVYQKS